MKIKTLIRLFLALLVPAVGILFLDWEMMKVLVVFQLELLGMYLAFYISYYLLDPKTKFPVGPSLFMLLLSLPVIIILLVMQFSVIYGLFELQWFSLQRIFSFGAEEFFEHWSWSLLLYFILLELVYQRVEKKQDPEHYQTMTYSIFRRLFMSNLFLLICCIPALLLEKSLFVAIPVLIGFKVILEYTGERYFLKRKKSKF